LAAIERLPVSGKNLLDYGCGTGILAILAAKQGARSVEAVDIELESYENTLDNCCVNQVEQVIARCGTLEAVEGRDFDGILANINRNVILDSFPRLYELIKPGGWLLCSGILAQDETIICESAAALGFQKKMQGQRGNWLCIEFQK
jgi:ribosomal protein L11 methyltransferase